MIALSALDQSLQYLIAAFYFGVTSFTLTLVIMQIIRRSTILNPIISGTLTLVLALVTAWLRTAAQFPDRLSDSIPWVVVVAALMPVLVYSIWSMVVFSSGKKKQLTASSVKTTLDNMDTAICFADQKEKSSS